MIDHKHHVSINGVSYRLAEDAEGQHYVRTYEPLRPPNAATVQGEAGAHFQVRPDVLLWSLTDWSGGEGQIKFDSEHPNRHRELEAVRVFDKPGQLIPGYYLEETLDSGGINPLAEWGQLAVADGKLVLYGTQTGQVYVWETTKWAAGVTLTGPGLAGGYSKGVTGDDTNFYFGENATNDIFKWPVTGSTATALDTSSLTGTNYVIAVLGPYIYAAGSSSSGTGELWEIPIDGTAETLIYEYGSGSASGLTPMNGRLYLLVRDGNQSSIHEILPTTAAGPGFGSELAFLPGVAGRDLWSHGGLLFVAGQIDGGDNAIFYAAPEGSFGTLGKVRPDVAVGLLVDSPHNSTLLAHFFTDNPNAASGAALRIFQVDSVSGGIAGIASLELAGAITKSLAIFEGNLFLSTTATGPVYRVYRAREDRYSPDCHAISAWHDFDLADEKVLGSLVLACEALPADWTLYVDYAKDGSSSWTNVITYTTDGGTGTRVAVSTDSSTVTFGTLSIRIRMEYTGAGAPSTAPVVLGVDVRATVLQPQRLWRLLLDLADSAGVDGATKIANLVTASEGKLVVQFDDGYHNRKAGAFTSADVIVDECALILDRPGEGLAQVTLREVP